MVQPGFRVLEMERVESKSPTNWVQRLLPANAEAAVPPLSGRTRNTGSTASH